jgi:hypothetical protein
MSNYPIIDLWVDRVGEGRYQSRLLGDGSEVRHTFGLDFRQVTVTQTLRALEAGATALGEAPPGFENQVALVGQQLYQALCGDPVGEAFRAALEAAHAAGQPHLQLISGLFSLTSSRAIHLHYTNICGLSSVVK